MSLPTRSGRKGTEVVQRAHANPIDNFAIAMKAKVEGLMIDRIEQNKEIVTHYLNDAEFQQVVFDPLVRRIYDAGRTGSKPNPPAR